MKVIIRFAIAILAFGTVFLIQSGAFAQASSSNDQSLKKVTLIVSTSGAPDVGSSTYSSLPQALGYWKAEGLNVVIESIAGSSAAMQLLNSGKGDATPSGASALMLANGAGMDLVSYYTNITRSFQNPAVPAGSNIKTITDLKGKTIGTANRESGNIPFVKGLLGRAGVELSTVTFVAVGTGAEAIAAVKAGRVDALALYDNIYANIENLGFPLRILTSDYSESLGFQVGLVAKRDWVKQNPAIAIGLARGIAKASLFAVTNPEAAVRLHWGIYPSTKPIGVDDKIALEQGIRTLKARMVNSGPVEGKWGYATPGQIAGYRDLLVSAGVVPEKVTAASLWTGDYIDEINKFSTANIIEEARKASAK